MIAQKRGGLSEKAGARRLQELRNIPSQRDEIGGRGLCR